MPGIAVTDILCFNTRRAIVDRQIERIDIGTDRTRLAMVESIGARGRIGRTVPTIAVTC